MSEVKVVKVKVKVVLRSAQRTFQESLNFWFLRCMEEGGNKSKGMDFKNVTRKPVATSQTVTKRYMENSLSHMPVYHKVININFYNETTPFFIERNSMEKALTYGDSR